MKMYPYITHHGKVIIEILRGRVADNRPLIVHDPLVGAEIGVWKGKNAATLLARAPGLTLYMCDYWGDPNAPKSDQSIQGQEAAALAKKETSFALTRRIIVNKKSPEAADRVQDGELDFAFIDGDHMYQPCLDDIRAWWPKIKPGGLMLGHDIDNPRDFAAEWGVRRAVEEFCVELDLPFDVYPDPAMVFAIRKSEL